MRSAGYTPTRPLTRRVRAEVYLRFANDGRVWNVSDKRTAHQHSASRMTRLDWMRNMLGLNAQAVNDPGGFLRFMDLVARFHESEIRSLHRRML